MRLSTVPFHRSAFRNCFQFQIATTRGDLCQVFFGVTISLNPALRKDVEVNPEKDSDALIDRERRVPVQVPLGKQLLVYAVILVIGFLLGLVPMWLSARQGARELETTRAELRRTQMQGALSGAALDARRGDYEPARKAMSDFFTALSGELDRGGDSALNQTQQDAVRPLLTQRDELITLLARSDPAAADRLTNLDASYRKAVGSSTAQK